MGEYEELFCLVSWTSHIHLVLAILMFYSGDSYTATGLTRDESDPVEANPLDDAGHFSV